MRTALRLLLVSALVAMGSLALETNPTDASVAGWYDCTPGRLCGWRDADAGFMIFSYPATYGDQTSRHIVSRDQLTSYWNRGEVRVVFGDYNASRGCYEFLFEAYPGWWGNLPSGLNDRADVVTIGFSSAPWAWC